VAMLGRSRKLIEVKATGARGFQRMSGRDTAADYLLWIHFGMYFESEDDAPITVYTIPQPGRFYKAREEAFVEDLPKKVGSALIQRDIHLGKLKEEGKQVSLC